MFIVYSFIFIAHCESLRCIVRHKSVITTLQPFITNCATLFLRNSMKFLESECFVKGFMPYDFYCPSLDGKIRRRICQPCKLYFPAITALKRHNVEHRADRDRRFTTDYILSSDDDASTPVNPAIPSDTNDGFPVIDNIFEFMRNTYEEA